MIRAIRRGLVRVVAAAVLLAVVVALPTALIVFVGWPLPPHVPTTGEVSRWLTSPLADDAVVDLLAVAAWLLWAAFLPAIAAEATTARRIRTTTATTPRTGNPLRLAAATLITAITLGTLSTAGTAAATTPAAALAAGPAQPVVAGRLVAWSSPTATAPMHGPATFVTGQRTYTHVVERGDTLSGVARDWLGDASRWPQICQLNWHRHWPDVGGRLTDCDLIYPGWTLRLPEDAVPPAGATPAQTPTDSAPRNDSPTTDPSPSPGHTLPSTAAQPPATEPPATETAAAPAFTSPSASPSAERPTSSSSSAATGTASPTGASAAGLSGDDTGRSDPGGSSERAPSPSRQDGVTLPGGFVPWSLAAAIAAAVAMVWLQRRRRHRPGRPDDDPADLPEPVLLLHREVARRPDLPAHPDLAERAAAVPDQVLVPPGGIGLVGEGAHAAARAALVAVLSTGGPRDPDRRAEAVIDGATLSSLIGVDAAALGPWPRLHVADDLDHALTLVDELLLHRARLLDENAAKTVTELREKAPSEEALPPVLLITESPSAGSRRRMRTALTLGADVDLTAILLDAWAHGPTVHVEADGRATCSDGPLPPTVPPRLGVLDADAAVAMLVTLREAHTGQRPTITVPASPSRDDQQAPSTAGPATPRNDTASNDSAANDTATDDTATDDTATDDTATDDTATDETDDPRRAGTGRAPTAGETKVRLRVLGPPDVLDVAEPGKPLRSKAAELAVFLVCHPGGADIRTIGDRLEPGVRLRDADVRIHTNVHNLRSYFGRAAGQRRMGYVIKANGKYRLDPTTVDVDLWELRALLTRAGTAPPERKIDLLRRACALCAEQLAAGCDYEWIEPHRERVRQETSEAHLLLAEALLPTDPREVTDLLGHAIGLDPYNEDLYKLAMRAHHGLGERDAIRDLLRQLTIAMADLDAEPEEETIALAQRLRAEPTARHPRSDLDRP